MSKLLIQSDLHQISEIPGYLQVYEALWGPMYEAVLTLLGSNGTILPIGDPYHGKPNATTFKTVGGEQVTFTWSEAPASFATSLDLADPANYQGVIPVVTFNGTDEEADSPDAAFWSRNDAGGANGFSMGAWVHETSQSGAVEVLAKWVASNYEWEFSITSGTLRLSLYDQSAAVQAYRVEDAAQGLNLWSFAVITYDGAGGASAANTIVIYRDGAAVASSATNNGSYVGMEDLTGVVTLGKDPGGSSFFTGKMAGGPLGPFFTQKQLSADEVRRLYEVGRRALTL